jgi:hypothetical protein
VPAHLAGELLGHAEQGLARPSDAAQPGLHSAGAPPAPGHAMHRHGLRPGRAKP